jgi:hypothetical protein
MDEMRAVSGQRSAFSRKREPGSKCRPPVKVTVELLAEDVVNAPRRLTAEC